MSGRTVARGAIVLIAAGLMLGAPAQANDAAHKMAEKFASSADGTEAKTKSAESQTADAKTAEAERKAAAAKKKEAEQKAQEARKREAQRRAEAKRRAAAQAERSADQRRHDETDMLARARREADEMRSAEDAARLAQEARRLVEEAVQERAKAEALLAGETQQAPAVATEDVKLAQQRAEETRRLAEKLNRVRQIREARLEAQARRKSQEQETAAISLPPPEPAVEAPPAARPEPASKPIEPPAAEVAASPAPPPAPSADAAAPPPLPPIAAPAVTPPPLVATVPDVKPTPQPRAVAEETQPQTVAEGTPAKLPPTFATKPSGDMSETRVTVLLILEPGTYGIRRGGAKIADPVLCVLEGCYVSAGADRPAVFMPGRKALSFANTWGGRAGACRDSLGCVFRGIELGSLPGYLQPVDLHILKHDRRRGHVVLADSRCRAEAGRLACSHGIYAEDYAMWIVPESLATTAGAAALQRALREGLNGPRSAQLAPR